MKLVVGLGNPGREYEGTRHNLGFMLVDKLFERSTGGHWRTEANADVAQIKLAGTQVLLVKPRTYMNLSGEAVGPLLERYAEGELASLIVVCDDVALPFGMLRVRARGSAGGQKGLKSIIERLGSSDFARVRLGIQPDHPVSDLSRFVLSPILKRDRESLQEVLDRGADAVEMMLTEGAERAMASFNKRIRSEND